MTCYISGPTGPYNTFPLPAAHSSSLVVGHGASAMGWTGFTGPIGYQAIGYTIDPPESSFDVIIGNESDVKSGNYNIVIGTRSVVLKGDSNVLIGSDVTLTGSNNIVLARNKTIHAQDSLIIGNMSINKAHLVDRYFQKKFRRKMPPPLVSIVALYCGDTERPIDLLSMIEDMVEDKMLRAMTRSFK